MVASSILIPGTMTTSCRRTHNAVRHASIQRPRSDSQGREATATGRALGRCVKPVQVGGGQVVARGHRSGPERTGIERCAWMF